MTNSGWGEYAEIRKDLQAAPYGHGGVLMDAFVKKDRLPLAMCAEMLGVSLNWARVKLDRAGVKFRIVNDKRWYEEEGVKRLASQKKEKK